MSSNNDSLQREDLLVAGVDLFRGSVLSHEEPTYAVSILSREKVVYEAQDITLPRLLRILHEYRPKYLVVDNLYELAPDKKSLIRILSLLPENTEIILATYDPVEGFRDLRAVAQLHGVYDSRRKPDASTTARILAKLGLLGVGHKIKIWEEKVKIIVSRNRSSRAGGSSEDRFKRASRAYVYRITNKIKDSLDRNGLAYEMMIKRSSGGIDRAVFIVEASREMLRGIVKPMRGRYVRVTIKPVIRSIVNLPREIETRPNLVIVGIDPGINYGIAILNLDGEIHATETISGGDLGVLLDKIRRYGVPVVVATDKKPVPESVKKIASIYGAKIYEPERVPTDAEKEKMIKELGYKVSSTHERDALYSAVSFYRKMLPKFSQIESLAQKLGIDMDLSKAKLEIIKGLDLATVIENIFSEILSEKNNRRNVLVIKDFIREYVSNENRLRNLEEEYNRVLTENNILRSRISELEKRVRDLYSELEDLKREFKQEIYRDREISMLVERLKTCHSYTKELENRIIDLEKKIINQREIIKDLMKSRYFVLKKIDRMPDHEISDLETQKITKEIGDREVRLEIAYISRVFDREEAIKLLEKNRSKRILVLTNDKCKFSCIGDELENICCISLPEISVEIIDLDEVVLIKNIDLDKIYIEYLNKVLSLPKRIIRSEEDLMRIIGEYRASRSSRKPIESNLI